MSNLRRPGATLATALRHPAAPFVALLLLALALRLTAVLWLSDTIPYSDYFYYHDAGRMVAQDWGFLFHRETVQKYGKLNWWPPGYPVFLGVLYSIFGVKFRAAVFAQVLMGTAVCGLVYAIGRRALGERGGRIAALLVAVNPTFVFMTNLIASENLFTFLLALGLWRAGRRDPARSQAWTGLLLGLATLTRAIGLLLPLIVAVWLRRRAPSRAAWRASAAWLLGAYALTLAPWTVRNAVVAGSPALVCFGGGLNFYFGHNDEKLGYREVSQTPMAGLKTAPAIDRRGYQLGFENLALNPLGFFTRGASKIRSLFERPGYALHANSAILIPDYRADPKRRPLADSLRAQQHVKDRWLHGSLDTLAAAHSWLLLAGALVACLGMWRRLPDELRLSAAICAYWITAHVVYWSQPRFRYPMEIPMTLLAAMALVGWRSLAPRRAARGASKRAALAAPRTRERGR